MLMVLGDFNANIGKEDFFQSRWQIHIMRQVTNESCWQNSAAEQCLSIVTTFFYHEIIHKGTCNHPQRRQIDHVLLSKRCASSVSVGRSARCPTCDSDSTWSEQQPQNYQNICSSRIPVVESRGTRKKRQNIDCFKDDQRKQVYERRLEELEGIHNNIDGTDDIEGIWALVKLQLQGIMQLKLQMR